MAAKAPGALAFSALRHTERKRNRFQGNGEKKTSRQIGVGMPEIRSAIALAAAMRLIAVPTRSMSRQNTVSNGTWPRHLDSTNVFTGDWGAFPEGCASRTEDKLSLGV